MAEQDDMANANAPSSRPKRRLPQSDEASPSLKKQKTGDCNDGSEQNGHRQPPRKRKRTLVSIRDQPLRYPKTIYVGYKDDKRISVESYSDERQALLHLKKEWNKMSNWSTENMDDFIAITLDAFAIYNPQTTAAQSPSAKSPLQLLDYEMVTLQDLQTLDRRRSQYLLLDGVLTLTGSNARYTVRQVPFEVVSVEGYGNLKKPGVTIWIQSYEGETQNAWYRLRRPATEYRRYYEPYIWIATFVKHVVDYVSQDLSQPNVAPRLGDFKENFYKWLARTYRRESSYHRWVAQYNGKTDFRIPLVAYQGYLWKEFAGVDPLLKKIKLINDISPLSDSPCWTAVPWQKPKELGTIVTPYVYSCFRSIYFASVLQEMQPSREVRRAQNTRARALGFASFKTDALADTATADAAGGRYRRFSGNVRVGDVIAVPRDSNGDSKWKDTADAWYGYVHGVDGSRIRVLWLRAPEHTALGGKGYPFTNELFLSDQCNCREKLTHRDVLGIVDVAWSPACIESVQGFFVRQMYCVEDDSFVTLRTNNNAQFICRCKKRRNTYESIAAEYSPGDTVLVLRKNTLEPVVIIGLRERIQRLEVRKLVRRQRNLKVMARPNELAWTHTAVNIRPQAVQRRCHIRFYSVEEIRAGRVPKPYNLDGQCDCWIVSTRLREIDGHRYEEELPDVLPTSMQVGFDPATQTIPPLRTLSLFSGAGSLDFGLEEGGAMSVDYHVEWDAYAVHTIRANSKENSQIFYGSVDDCLYYAMAGKGSPLVPMIDQVEALAAGSPCQGFSMLQADALCERSLRNASKVASVASYIDLYRPIYAVLENVPSMARRPIKEQNVFQRLLCVLVGLGYQVSHFLLDAWTLGAPTKRSRLFIILTAPGFTPPKRPSLTHSSPPNTTERSLGVLVNGDRFGVSRDEIAPFDFVTVRQATSDLPKIDDGHVDTCIPYPDHRSYFQVRLRDRLIIQSVPINPPGMGFAQTLSADVDVPEVVRDYWQNHNQLRQGKDSNSWRRIDPNGLFPTITTKLVPADYRNGYGVHWDEDRVWTVMEARRAHGIPDDFVIVGNPVQQWKQIGNGVARPVALALGMSIRRAWQANTSEMIEQARRGAGLDAYSDPGAEASPSTNTPSNITPRKNSAAKAVAVRRSISRGPVAVPITPPTAEQRRRYWIIDISDSDSDEVEVNE